MASLQGEAVLSVSENRPSGAGLRLFRRRGARFSLLLFSQHLISLLEAGLNVVEAIEALAEDEAEQGAERVLSDLMNSLRNGQPLSVALRQYPEHFPDYYVATIRASEQSSSIAETLQRWVSYQSAIELARRQVTQALLYPTVLVIAGVAVCLFLLIYVIPRFAQIYEGRMDDLPWLSMLLVEWGQAVASQGVLMFVLAAIAFLAIGWGLSRTVVRERLWAFAWKLPWVGGQLRLYQLARLYRTIGMLLRGGMPITDALDLAPGLMVSALQSRVLIAAVRIRAGHSILDAFQTAGLVTPVSIRMLHVGEHAGNMDEMMERVASYYDDVTARALVAFVKIFEPAVMAVIGLMVGGIVVLMYIPIFEIAGRLQS